ncbi:vitamin B12 transporter BtuB [bacterium BMS3Bbin04]|nr:vitamin B12 transporter BtuB [bacterium BMS3Bbin04]
MPSAGRWSADLGAGSAYALPSFTNRFLVESVFALGNPNLKPERVQDVHCGLNWIQPLAVNSRLSGSLKGFLRNTNNMVVWQRNWRGQYYPDNLDQAKAYGVELATSWRSDFLLKEVTGALTWQNVLNATPNSPWYGNRVPFQPELFGNLGGSVTITSQVDLLADMRFASRRFSRESNLDPLSATGAGMEPYTVLNVALRWQVRLEESRLLITSTTGVDNVTDLRYELLERMPMPGRTWRLQLKLQQK